MTKFALAAPVLALAATVAPLGADDKKPTSPLVLKVIAKTDSYKFDGSGKTPAEFKKMLEDVAAQQKDGQIVAGPKPPTVDLILRIENTSKDDVTIYVGGDVNVATFDLTGGTGVVTVPAAVALTADFKLPKAVKLEAGKSYDIPVKQLSDGLRGMSRNVYWTGPGEYKLAARYRLSTEDGGKAAELKSEPVKITVTEK